MPKSLLYTIEECLDDVSQGKADFAIYNAYTMNYLIQKPRI